MQKSNRGVFIDTKYSDIKYKFNNITFYFSSKFYKEKFKNNVEDYIENEIAKFNNKHTNKITVDNIELFINFFTIDYYKKIEKRGWRYNYGD